MNKIIYIAISILILLGIDGFAIASSPEAWEDSKKEIIEAVKKDISKGLINPKIVVDQFTGLALCSGQSKYSKKQLIILCVYDHNNKKVGISSEFELEDIQAYKQLFDENKSLKEKLILAQKNTTLLNDLSITNKTKCNNFHSNLKYSIYFTIYKPTLDAMINLIKKRMDGNINKTDYFENIQGIAEGFLTLHQVYGANTGRKIAESALTTIGYTMNEAGLNIFAEIIDVAVAASKVAKNPTPASIADYVVMKSLSILNNIWGTVKHTKLKHQLDVMSASRDVLSKYYLNCQNREKISSELLVNSSPWDNDCKGSWLLCTTVQYCKRIGYYVNKEKISDTILNIISGVDSNYMVLIEMNNN